MTDFTVSRYGTDSGGRAIWMTAYMHDWLQGVYTDLGFAPTIVQGAFMTRNGGGASASAGYHDRGGCIDFRIWDLSATQQDRLVRVLREHGAAAWRRDQRHGGMDPHCHIVLGTDSPLAAGAAAQWRQYRLGFDGLASNGPDYEWRPSPLVLTPPVEDDVTPEQQKQLDRIEAKLEDIDKVLARITKAKREVIHAVEDNK